VSRSDYDFYHLNPSVMRFLIARRKRPMWSARCLPLWSLILLIGACRNLLDAGPNGLTQPAQFENPSGAVMQGNAAIASFATAASEQALWSGVVADELTSYGAGFDAIDALHITVENAANTYPYADLSTARLAGLRAIQALEQYAPAPRSRVGELFALVGLVELYFAEDMCSGVPLANVVGGLPMNGPTLSRDSLIGRAISHFDSAAASTSDSGIINTQVLWLAHVAKGRALLAADQFANAAVAVSDVPASFNYETADFDGVLQFNAINIETFATFVFSVADHEGVNGLDFISANDPRVTITANGTPDGIDTAYVPASDTSVTAPIITASGVEASLIRAEATLQLGQAGAWADTLNALREAFPDTALSNHPLLADSTTAASASVQQDVMFRERAFWLFLSGHRQGDLRRLVRQYHRGVGAVFPTGPYTKLGPGGSYGTAVTFVPVGEQTNPDFQGCIDRNP
jgi:hypothetical protein